jgi:hypothetical protein
MSDATTASSSTATVLEPSSSGSGSSEENYSPSTRIRKKKGLSRISVTTVTRNTTSTNENENTNRAIDETAVILTFNTLVEQLLIVGKKYNGIDQTNLNELSKLRLIDKDDDDDNNNDDTNNKIGEMNQSDVKQIKSLQNNQRIMLDSFNPPDELKKKIDTRLDKALHDIKAMANVKAFTIINNVCSEYDLESNGGIYYENLKTEFSPEIIRVDQLFMDTFCFNRITLELVHIIRYLESRKNPLYYMICRQKIEMIHKTALHKDSSFFDKYDFMAKRVGQYYAIIVNFALSNPRTKPLSFRGHDVGNINNGKSMS